MFLKFPQKRFPILKICPKFSFNYTSQYPPKIVTFGILGEFLKTNATACVFFWIVWQFLGFFFSCGTFLHRMWWVYAHFASSLIWHCRYAYFTNYNRAYPANFKHIEAYFDPCKCIKIHALHILIIKIRFEEHLNYLLVKYTNWILTLP